MCLNNYLLSRHSTKPNVSIPGAGAGMVQHGNQQNSSWITQILRSRDLNCIQYSVTIVTLPQKLKLSKCFISKQYKRQQLIY